MRRVHTTSLTALSTQAKRSRVEGDEALQPRWTGEQELEPKEHLDDGPVTVDHIQRVVERRLQVAPGWRAQRRQIHLARAQRQEFRHFIQRILDNDPTLGECASRVLRLKPTLDLDTTTFEIDMVLEALRYNLRIEALYIHNFEQVRHSGGNHALSNDLCLGASKRMSSVTVRFQEDSCLPY